MIIFIFSLSIESFCSANVVRCEGDEVEIERFEMKHI
jgi:hypothetical protein